MLRSKFFWKLYLTFAGLMLVTVVATGSLVHRQLARNLLADVQSRLLAIAVSLEPTAVAAFRDAGRGAALQAEIEQIGERLDTRVTLVAPDGSVLADSDRDPATMDNHADRPEIVASRTSPYGVSQRFSNTARQRMSYVAVAVRSGGRVVGTVRTSIPLVDVDARLASLRSTIALGAGIGVLVALAAGLFGAHRITAPVTRMTEVAEALRAGDYEQRVAGGGNHDEVGLLGATLDLLADEVTARIATLAEQKAQLGAMLAGLQEAVFAVDERGRLVFSNTAARRLLSVPSGAGIVLWESVDDARLRELCTRAAGSGVSERCEIEIDPADGPIVLDARATPFVADGEGGVVVVLYDITNLRRLEEMRTEFVANVSHELKTPLTAIQGFVETLIDGAIHDDANNMRFLGKIGSHVERLDAMVNDLLALARIESESLTASKEATDWRSVIDVVVDSYREAGRLSKHHCVVDTPSVPVEATGEHASMTQILENLLENALKYTPAGGTITIRAGLDGDRTSLEVEDNGIGIAQADVDRVFERFFRTDRARSRAAGGTGLGLAIVKHLAQGLGGEVELKSQLGRGSCFTVHLPVADTRQAPTLRL